MWSIYCNEGERRPARNLSRGEEDRYQGNSGSLCRAWFGTMGTILSGWADNFCSFCHWAPWARGLTPWKCNFTGPEIFYKL